MKRYRKLIAACLAPLLLLTACGESAPRENDLPDIPVTELPQEAPSEPATLRVLSNTVDPSQSGPGMDFELRRLAARYQEEHENVTIEVEFLSTDSELRKNQVDRLRTEILAGKGPDIFLMSSTCQTYDGSYYRKEFEDLFPDVALAMRNGVFCDIRTLYDADEALGKEALDAAVMDAGVVRGARYVLPLRYNFPMVLADREALDDSGMNQKNMRRSVTGLYQELLEKGGPVWARGALPSIITDTEKMSVFSQLIDYDRAEVTLDAEEVETYLEQCAQLEPLRSPSWFGVQDISGQVLADKLFLDASNPDGMPLCVLDLFDTPQVAGAAKFLGKELTMFPLRATDGSLSAYVTFWGAVSAGCQRPRAAYDFLRLFLLEDSQWELARRPPKVDPEDVDRTDFSGFSPGMFTNGWPVRSAGAVEAMWPGIRAQVTPRAYLFGPEFDADVEIVLKYWEMELTSADVAPMLEPVDAARFPIAVDFGFQGYHYAVAAGDVTAAEAAEKLLESIRWHLDEG